MTTSKRPPAPHRSAAFALDPYRIDECTFTRGEIVRARGLAPARHPRRRVRAARPTRHDTTRHRRAA